MSQRLVNAGLSLISVIGDPAPRFMLRTTIPAPCLRTAATDCKTTAERAPGWETLKAQLPAGTPKPPDDLLVPGAMVFVGTDQPVELNDYTQWWQFVPGADWRHPQGPGSAIAGKEDYPVVQVSYEDAQEPGPSA